MPSQPCQWQQWTMITMRSRREALLKCLETAARRYRIPWTQTTIDILGRHEYESVGRFTARQREAVEKLWNSIKEQQIRRKHGKSVSGKLDVNAFERLRRSLCRNGEDDKVKMKC